MKKLTILLVAVVFGMSCTMQNSKTKILQKKDVISFLSSLQSDSSNSLLIDVRTPKEYAEGKIGDAINVNFYDSDFYEQVSKLDNSKTAYIYCRSGGRSGKAAKIFEEHGFKKIVDLKGGYNAYLRR